MDGSGPDSPLDRPLDRALVRDLLADQHPDLLDLPIGEPEHGWDNAVFRLGADLAVRLPRRPEGAALIDAEQRWLPGLAAQVPVEVPTPVRSGEPGLGYPWRWSVCRWVEGTTALSVPLTDPTTTARAAAALGGFLAALHHPAPPDAPANPFRGVPLAARAGRLHDALEVVRSTPRALGSGREAQVLRFWSERVEEVPWTSPPVWIHGDLHPGNLVFRDGTLRGVIDWGDLTAGDPATDLAVAWMLFDAGDRDRLRDAVGSVTDTTWRRAEAWALALSIAYLEGSPDGSPLLEVASRTLARLLD